MLLWTWVNKQIPLWDSASILGGYIPTSGVATSISYGNSISNFWGSSILSSTAAVPFYIPTNIAQRFNFLHILLNTCYFLFCFCSSHPNGYEMQTPNGSWYWAYFHVFIGYSYAFLGQCLFKSFASLLVLSPLPVPQPRPSGICGVLVPPCPSPIVMWDTHPHSPSPIAPAPERRPEEWLIFTAPNFLFLWLFRASCWRLAPWALETGSQKAS